MKIISTLSLFSVFIANNATAQNIFPATGRAGIYTASPAASLQVRGGARIGTPANYVNIDSATGNLSFNGTSAYRVAGNRYAFQYASNPNYGLYFNSTNVQYEFRNGSAVPVFYVNANNGNAVFTGNLKIGTYTLPATDGVNGQVLTTNGSGAVSWTVVAGGGNGANKTLSNLSAATAVNVPLLPGTDNNTDIGSSLFSWKDIYLKGGLYFNGIKMMQYKAGVNTIIGEGAGSTGSGGFNTALGSNTLSANTTGDSNVGIGENSLVYNTTGSNNTATGYAALISNATGSSNAAFGFSALYSNSTGRYNSAFGNNALYYNISGSYNTGVGISALRVNTADENTAIGAYALSDNSGGIQNTAAGAYSLTANSNGYQNTAMGYSALAANDNGYSNAAFGYYALYNSTNSSANCAFGNEALVNNYGDAGGNCAFGYRALYSNTTGGTNVAMGYAALFSNTTGYVNIAVGYGAMERNSSGNNNVAVGQRALNWNTTGEGNTAIGTGANTNFISNLNNATAIGYDAQVDASNKVRIGNTSVSSIGGQVTWTSFSDARIKKDIKENVPGLNFIKMLRPITFHYDLNKENEMMGIKGSKDFKEKYDIEKISFTGFAAQDVDEAAKKINYDFSGVDKTGKIWGIRYAEFVVPLVKAVQELDKKTQEIDELKTEVEELKKLVQSLVQIKSSTSNNYSLEQNIPNPFNQSTTINYTLPAKFSSANIIVTDNNGKTIKQFTLSAAGKGSVTIAAGTLASGLYHYALYVDGKMIDSKKMEIMR